MLALGLSSSLPVKATNGINFIGFGAESTLVGGADTAVARDTSAINASPSAGLAQIQAACLLALAPYYVLLTPPQGRLKRPAC